MGTAPIVPEANIQIAAATLLRTHGVEAESHCVFMIKKWEKRDQEGAEVWRRVLLAIQEQTSRGRIKPRGPLQGPDSLQLCAARHPAP
jgi:hypothetical protein